MLFCSSSVDFGSVSKWIKKKKKKIIGLEIIHREDLNPL